MRCLEESPGPSGPGLFCHSLLPPGEGARRADEGTVARNSLRTGTAPGGHAWLRCSACFMAKQAYKQQRKGSSKQPSRLLMWMQ
ncbi:MAG: hypothetical protein EOP02_38180 [Proteobacteria bacterium]|nr:MAG: hypothetical protein EOP02_38180 [Pseudomonadota bacterium]